MPQALVVREFGGPEALVVADVPELVPAPGEVVVDLRAAALNRRDLRVVAGGWPGVSAPLVPGSDGAGVVRALGPASAGSRRATRSSSSPGSTGATIRACSGRASRSSAAPTTARSPSRCACPAANVFAKPARLDWERGRGPAAGRPDGVARALHARRPALGPDGADPRRGRGHLDVRRPVRACGRARACSSPRARPSKIARAVELGAEAGFDYRAEGWEQEVVERSGGGVDLVIDSAGTWQSSVTCVRAGGRVVVFGSTVSPTTELDVRGYYFRQLDLVGTMMGSPLDFRAMLRACETQSVDAGRRLGAAARAGGRRARAAWRRASTSASSSSRPDTPLFGQAKRVTPFVDQSPRACVACGCRSVERRGAPGMSQMHRAVIPYESIDPLTIGAAENDELSVPGHARARHPRGQPAGRDLARRARGRRRRHRGRARTRSSTRSPGPRFSELLKPASERRDRDRQPVPADAAVAHPARRLRRDRGRRHHGRRSSSARTARSSRCRSPTPSRRSARTTSRAWSAWASRSSRTTRRTRRCYTFVGVSSRGTPVWLHKEVAKRDLKITIGQAQSNHWGAGGGGKLILPGVTSDETVESNHCAFVPSPQTHYGAYRGPDALRHRRGRDDVRPASAR